MLGPSYNGVVSTLTLLSNSRYLNTLQRRYVIDVTHKYDSVIDIHKTPSVHFPLLKMFILIKLCNVICVKSINFKRTCSLHDGNDPFSITLLGRT